MALAKISIKLIFLPKRKESSVPLLVIQIYFMALQWFAYELSLLQVYAWRHVFLLSIIDLYLSYSL